MTSPALSPDQRKLQVLTTSIMGTAHTVLRADAVKRRKKWD